jgi:hypothetical protein
VALERCRESQAVEFKEATDWSSIKHRTIRTVMAMSNLRDGGVVIVGVSEAGDSWDLTGMADAQLGTYDVDDITDGINRYASPPIEPEVVIVLHDDKKFLAIQVPEFSESPCVCKRTDNDGQRAFYEGAVYVRPAGKAQTTRVTRAEDMSDLLELAAEKRARGMIETGHRIGMVVAADSHFDDELEWLTGQPHLPVAVIDRPHWRINIRPQDYNPQLIPSLSACRQIVQKAAVRLRGWEYPHVSDRAGEHANGNDWTASWNEFGDKLEYWRFYQSGQFLHLLSIPEQANLEQLKQELAQNVDDLPQDFDWAGVPGFLPVDSAMYKISEIVEFAARLAQSGLYQGRVDLTIELVNVRGFMLFDSRQPWWHRFCVAHEDNIAHTWQLPTDVLIADATTPTLDALLWLVERFGWMDPPDDTFRKDIQDFREGHL